MENHSFAYKAADNAGHLVNGEIAAPSEKVAVRMLHQQGLTPLRISGLDKGLSATQQPQEKVSFKDTQTSKAGAARRSNLMLKLRRRKVGTRDLVMFCQDLAVLLGAGVPLSRSLNIVSGLIEKHSFQEIVENLHDGIKEGSSFWQALGAHPGVFSPVFVNMVRAGEASGTLEKILERLGDYLDGIQELKEYLLSALMYPLFLIVTAIGSVAVLLAVVIPKFAAIFNDMGVALPLSTRVMLTSGDFLQSYGWVLAILIAVSIALLRLYHSTDSGRYRLDRIKAQIPFLGQILVKIELSRFCRTFGTLLDSGVPILEALKMVQGVLHNRVLNKSIEDVHSRLKQGEILSAALRRNNLFPAMAVQMITVGEETGRMDTMLMRIADMYDREIKVKIKAFTSLFEPVIILLMGLVIGAMVVSMLMAIFSVNDMGF